MGYLSPHNCQKCGHENMEKHAVDASVTSNITNVGNIYYTIINLVKLTEVKLTRVGTLHVTRRDGWMNTGCSVIVPG